MAEPSGTVRVTPEGATFEIDTAALSVHVNTPASRYIYYKFGAEDVMATHEDPYFSFGGKEIPIPDGATHVGLLTDIEWQDVNYTFHYAPEGFVGQPPAPGEGPWAGQDGSWVAIPGDGGGDGLQEVIASPAPNRLGIAVTSEPARAIVGLNIADLASGGAPFTAYDFAVWTSTDNSNKKINGQQILDAAGAQLQPTAPEGGPWAGDDGGWVPIPTGGEGNLPAGGTQGQHLAKSSEVDFEAEWVDPPETVIPTPLLLEDGSATAPSLAFANAPQAGLYMKLGEQSGLPNVMATSPFSVQGHTDVAIVDVTAVGGPAQLHLHSSQGGSQFYFILNDLTQWMLRSPDNFEIRRFDDTGTFVANAIEIDRSNGMVTFETSVSIDGVPVDAALLGQIGEGVTQDYVDTGDTNSVTTANTYTDEQIISAINDLPAAPVPYVSSASYEETIYPRGMIVNNSGTIYKALANNVVAGADFTNTEQWRDVTGEVLIVTAGGVPSSNLGIGSLFLSTVTGNVSSMTDTGWHSLSTQTQMDALQQELATLRSEYDAYVAAHP